MEEESTVISLLVHVYECFAIREKRRCDQFGRKLNGMVPVKNVWELRWYSECFHERD